MSFLNYPSIKDNGQGEVSINGILNIDSPNNNQPLQITTKNGSFELSFDENNNAIISGGVSQEFSLAFIGTDRVKMQGVSGDNRLATLADLDNIIISGGSAASGYWYKFSNGLILQTRLLTSIGTPGNSMNINYPIAFPTACIGASAFLGNINTTYFVAGISPSFSLSALQVSLSQALTSPNAASLSLIAIGF